MSTDKDEGESKGGGDTLETKADQNGEDGGLFENGLTDEELAMTRRGAIGTGAALLLGAGFVMGQASQLEGDTGDDIYAAALTTSLTSLKSKDQYYSGPKSAFDPAELESGQLAVVPDDWGVAVKGEDGTMEVPSFGSTGTPVPSVTTELLDIVGENGEATTIEPQDTVSGGIQEAIDAASAGDTLILKPNTTYNTEGTYSDGDLITIPATLTGLTLVGFGAGSLVKHDGTTTVSGEGSRLFRVKADEVTFKNFKIDGDQQNSGTIDPATDGHNIAVDGDHFMMEGVRSWNSTGDGVEPWNNAVDTVITGCNFRNNWEQNVHINGVASLKLSNSTLFGGENNGQISTFCGTGDVTESIVIDGCTIRGGNTPGLSIDPGHGTVKHVEISDTIIENIGGGQNGVVINYSSTADNQPDDIRFKDLTVQGCDFHGIRIETGSHIRFTDCTIQDNDVSGVLIEAESNISDLRFEGCDIYNNGRDVPSGSNPFGIKADAVDFTVDALYVERCHFVVDEAGASHSMSIQNLASGTGGFTNTYIRENSFRGESNRPLDINSAVTEIKENDGHVTEADGTGSVADGEAIAHGLATGVVPDYIHVETRSANHAAFNGTVDATDFHVQLTDPSGASVGTAETVQWEARLHDGSTR